MNLEMRFGSTWSLSPDGDRIKVRFGFNRKAIEIIKTFKGARWNPDDKVWSIAACPRNMFQLKAMSKGGNPYQDYDSPLILRTDFSRPLYEHQKELVSAALQYKRVIFAAEMGTGKTLAAYEVMERSGSQDWWWIGPKSALAAVQLEMHKWKVRVNPTFMTYERLTKVMAAWGNGEAPFGVVFDESSKIKTETAQRSRAALALANGVREDRDGYIILMTGTPAPKDPTNWWHQTEVACPGFLREGDTIKLRRRLAVVEDRTNIITGGIYPHLVGWRDTEDRCAECGKFEHEHETTPHVFRPGVNEVAKLYTRMKGLVWVKFKKDCLSLPDKRYEIIRCQPSVQILRLAKMIKNTESRAVTVLMLLRELSDGFQYRETPTGQYRECGECHGTGKAIEVVVEEEDTTTGNRPEMIGEAEMTCPNCGGKGQLPTYERTVIETPSPKYDKLEEILENHEEVGRCVIYASFSASIDRLVKFCRSKKWDVIRVDGRGWMYFGDQDVMVHPERLLQLFQDGDGRIVFIGHPGSAGMGLTLTASPTIVYFSNTFNAEDRIQSEDRIHRPGMDENRGATIIDIVHLETDQLILDNLKKKKDLQNMSMGELESVFREETS